MAKKPAKKPSVSKSASNGPRIVPLGDKVLVKEVTEKDTNKKTDSGIFIPDTVKEEKDTKKGKVVAVGRGRLEDGKLVPLEVKVGDTVLFSWGDKVKIDGEEYMIVRESEISAVIK